MTTLAIIGSGLVGKSLIYSLAKEQKQFEKITLFSSDNILPPCTLSSTAIAAPRGTTPGLSELGDLLVAGFETLKDHIELNRPHGVQEITQYSAATFKTEQFIKRYPEAKSDKTFLKTPALMIQEPAYMFDPKSYTDWLLNEAMLLKPDHIEVIDDLVLELTEGERVHLKTLNGRNLAFDKVVFAGGNYNRFWKDLLPESKLKSSKPAQGSYFEFQNVNWTHPSFSLTLDGDNIVWNAPFKRMYVGSTTEDVCHFLPSKNELHEIYSRLKEKTSLDLPAVADGIIRTGLREKAQRREPYLVSGEKVCFIGGMYKNAFTLSIQMTRSLSHQLL